MNRFSATLLAFGRVLAVTVVFTCVASAQETGGLRGVVTTVGSNSETEPIDGATLGLECKNAPGGARSSTTSANGKYSFSGLADGICLLTVSRSGFVQQTKQVTIQGGSVSTVDVHLALEPVDQKVVVRAEGSTLATEAPRATSTLSGEQVRELPLAREKFSQALEVMPGVIATASGKLTVRGATEDQGMLLVDSAKTVDPVTGSFSVPVPIDAISSLSVDRSLYDAQYDGFSGGLASIQTKNPPSRWAYGLHDVNVSLRAKNGHLVGISHASPRLDFGGPLLAGKLNFSEAFQYDLRKDPVRGLSWPRNEVKRNGFNSYSTFQAILSQHHLLTAHANIFSERTEFANIDALLPQTASMNDGRRGGALELSDVYSFESGALLRTVLEYTRFDTNAHGQGPSDLLITPEGWTGNSFDSWSRYANAFEASPVYQFPGGSWHGRHQVSLGADVTWRSYSGLDHSHPIDMLRLDGTLAERIGFEGAGIQSASAKDVTEFVEDRWTVDGHFALNLGGQLVTQSPGRSIAFAPRVGLARSLGKSEKTVVRAGAGLFYGSVPLLATDFAANPVRIVSLYDATEHLLGNPVAFQNVYIASGSGPLLGRVRRRPDTSPRSFSAQVALDQQLNSGAALHFAYTFTETHNLFVVNPEPLPSGGSILALTNSGNFYDHQLVASLRLRPYRRAELNVSYIWSRARGDINTFSDLYVPFEQPVIRPNVRGVLPSDVPDRLVTSGLLRLPWGFTISPVIDLHNGSRYSSIDDLQDYVGEPYTRQYPTFFSLDLKVYREFRLPFRFLRRRKVRIGYYSRNITNHGNYNAVYNDVTSPQFGQFIGFERRVNGIVLDIVQ